MTPTRVATVSGAAVAVVDGDVRWLAVDGHSDPRAAILVDPETQFAIASITKTFTSTSATGRLRGDLAGASRSTTEVTSGR